MGDIWGGGGGGGGEIILRQTDNLLKSLQNMSISARVILQELKEKGSTEQFDRFWEALNVDLPAPKRRRSMLRFEAEGAAQHTFDFHQIYFDAYDTVIAGIQQDVGQRDSQTYRNLQDTFLNCIQGREFDSEVRSVVETFATDLKDADLRVQLGQFRETIAVEKPSKVMIFDHIEVFNLHARMRGKTAIATSCSFRKMIATNATSEWCFLTMKRIKTYLRNNTSDNRLNHLMFLRAHCDKIDEFKIEMWQLNLSGTIKPLTCISMVLRCIYQTNLYSWVS